MKQADFLPPPAVGFGWQLRYAVWGYVESLLAGICDTENDIPDDDGCRNVDIVADMLFIVIGSYYEQVGWREFDASLCRIPVPIRFIEEKTDMTFFPDVPESVMERRDLSDWGF